MAKVIVYAQADGSVAIGSIGWVHPPPVQDVDAALAAAPAGAIVVDEAQLPDRRATDAWVLGADGTLSVDLEKVRVRRRLVAAADGSAALGELDRMKRLGIYDAQEARGAEADLKERLAARLAAIAAAKTIDELLDL